MQPLVRLAKALGELVVKIINTNEKQHEGSLYKLILSSLPDWFAAEPSAAPIGGISAMRHMA